MSDDAGPSDTMTGRSGGSTVIHWLLLDANRWVVTVVLMAFVFAGLLVVGRFSPASLRQLLTAADPVETLFQALVTALITGVTLVVTINQLVLSQELGAVEDQRERLDGALTFREDVEAAIDAPIGPPEPAAFVGSIVVASSERAADLRDAVADSPNEELRARVDEFADNLTSHADAVRDDLETAEFGAYEVVKAALDYNYSWKIFRVRRIERAYADSFDDETREAYEALLETLELFGLAREHFKTLYFQWELINLSRAMMYLAVPALVVTISMILFFDATVAAGTYLGVDALVWLVAASATLAVAPFLLLIAFVLRIGTIAKRTLAIGPFILRESNRGEAIDWEGE